jgi:general secretion pathway protein M
MKEWQMKIKEWWSTLSQREQQAVSLGSVAVGILLFYAIIWGPYLDRIDIMRKQIKSEQQMLAWMQAADKEIRLLENQTKNKNAVTTPVILLSVLQKQVDQAGLKDRLTGLKQASNDSVEMHFQKVEFDVLIQLLMDVLKTQNVSVTQLAVIAEATPGIVNADLFLKII